jgi:O-antigen/teichoic acid export membrane protein
LIKSSLVYTLSSIVSAIVPFILLPILTRVLIPEDLGRISMFTIYTGVLGAFVGVNVSGAAARRFFDEGVSFGDLAKYNGACFLILILSTLILLFATLIVGDFISGYLGIPLFWLYLGLGYSFCSFCLHFRLSQWQVREDAKAYGVLQVAQAFLSLVLSLVLVLVYMQEASGRINGMLYAVIAAAFFSLFSLIQNNLVKYSFCKKDIIDALSFGFPLIPHVVGGFLILSVDRVLLNSEFGLGITGVYMVVASLAAGFNIIFNSINRAYTPWLFKQLKVDNEQIKIKIVKSTYLYFIVLIVLASISYFLAPVIFKMLVGQKFHSGAVILPVLILGQVFFGMYLMVTNYIFYARKTKYLSFLTVFTGALNIVLLLFMIPKFGLMGAALSFLIANMSRFLLTWYLSSKVYPMPWRF